jgi:hypothetical protein
MAPSGRPTPPGQGNGRTLYLTARTGLYRIRTNIPGIRPVLRAS